MTGLSVWALISIPLHSTEGGLGCRMGLHVTGFLREAPAFFLLHSIGLPLPPKQRRKALPMVQVSASGSFFLLGMATGSSLNPPT